MSINFQAHRTAIQHSPVLASAACFVCTCDFIVVVVLTDCRHGFATEKERHKYIILELVKVSFKENKRERVSEKNTRLCSCHVFEKEIKYADCIGATKTANHK